MTECQRLLEELKAKAQELDSAERAARAPRASEKDLSDTRMLREEFMALRRRAADLVEESGTPGDEEVLARLTAAQPGPLTRRLQ